MTDHIVYITAYIHIYTCIYAYIYHKSVSKDSHIDPYICNSTRKACTK